MPSLPGAAAQLSLAHSSHALAFVPWSFLLIHLNRPFPCDQRQSSIPLGCSCIFPRWFCPCVIPAGGRGRVYALEPSSNRRAMWGATLLPLLPIPVMQTPAPSPNMDRVCKRRVLKSGGRTGFPARVQVTALPTHSVGLPHLRGPLAHKGITAHRSSHSRYRALLK